MPEGRELLLIELRIDEASSSHVLHRGWRETSASEYPRRVLDSHLSLPYGVLLLGLTSLALCLAGCRRDEKTASAPSASARSSASAAPAAFDPTPSVELLDPGQAPRTPIRVEPKLGVRQQLRVNWVAKATQQVEDQKSDVSPPASAATLDARVTEIVPMGAFVVITYAREGAPADSKVNEVLERSVMRVLVMPSGAVKQAGAQGPVLQDPEALRVLRNASSTLVSSALPLPTEPVGKGAKWRVSVRLPGAVTVEQQAEVELVERLENEVKLRVGGKLLAAPQPIRIPGAAMKLERFVGTLRGEWTVPLDRPLYLGALTADSQQFAVDASAGNERRVVTHTVATRTYAPASEAPEESSFDGGIPEAGAGQP